jgi:hypothetical protein
MKESNLPKADFVSSIFLVVFGAGVLWASVAMPRFEEQGGVVYDAPGVVPGIIGVLVIALSIVMLVRSIGQQGYRLGITDKTVGAVLRDAQTLRMLGTVVTCVLYALVLLRFLHFIAGTLIFVLVFVLLFEYDLKKSPASQWKVLLFAVLMSVLTTGGVYAAFRYLFLVNLP